MPEPLVRLTREREPGTPWELGDRLIITFTDERGRELEGVGFICTAVHRNGQIIEAVSERLPLTRLTFPEDTGSLDDLYIQWQGLREKILRLRSEKLYGKRRAAEQAQAANEEDFD